MPEHASTSTSTTAIAQSLHRFADRLAPGDGEIRNHLSVAGTPSGVNAFLEQARTSDDGRTTLDLDGHRLPVGAEAQLVRTRTGEWLTMEPGRVPERHEERQEHAEASFAFASGDALDEAVAASSRRHPELEFRYACLHHRALRGDTARGSLWRAGREVASHVGRANGDERAALAALVEEVEALEAPPPAVKAAP